MNRKITTLILAAALGISTIGLAACDNKGPAEKAGEKVDNATNKARDAMDNAADKTGDAADKAGDKLKDSTGN
ncbi:MAG: hypothetical protein PF501_20180 [Salinisphaera sp.]|jgi:predicted small lipoprotein YifL|nr:hypothetical protein [Salinisphaera sp.]